MAENEQIKTAEDIFTEMSQCTPEEIEAMDHKHILRAWTPVGEPVLIERGQGPYVWDVFGKKYIDCNSGLFSNNAGFSNPKILDAVVRLVSKVIQTSMRQSNVPAVFLAAKLARITPGDLDQIYYTFMPPTYKKLYKKQGVCNKSRLSCCLRRLNVSLKLRLGKQVTSVRTLLGDFVYRF